MASVAKPEVKNTAQSAVKPVQQQTATKPVPQQTATKPVQHAVKPAQTQPVQPVVKPTPTLSQVKPVQPHPVAKPVQPSVKPTPSFVPTKAFVPSQPATKPIPTAVVKTDQTKAAPPPPTKPVPTPQQPAKTAPPVVVKPDQSKAALPTQPVKTTPSAIAKPTPSAVAKPTPSAVVKPDQTKAALLTQPVKPAVPAAITKDVKPETKAPAPPAVSESKDEPAESEDESFKAESEDYDEYTSEEEDEEEENDSGDGEHEDTVGEKEPDAAEEMVTDDKDENNEKEGEEDEEKEDEEELKEMEAPVSVLINEVKESAYELQVEAMEAFEQGEDIADSDGDDEEENEDEEEEDEDSFIDNEEVDDAEIEDENEEEDVVSSFFGRLRNQASQRSTSTKKIVNSMRIDDDDLADLDEADDDGDEDEGTKKKKGGEKKPKKLTKQEIAEAQRQKEAEMQQNVDNRQQELQLVRDSVPRPEDPDTASTYGQYIQYVALVREMTDGIWANNTSAETSFSNLFDVNCPAAWTNIPKDVIASNELVMRALNTVRTKIQNALITFQTPLVDNVMVRDIHSKQFIPFLIALHTVILPRRIQFKAFNPDTAGASAKDGVKCSVSGKIVSAKNAAGWVVMWCGLNENVFNDACSMHRFLQNPAHNFKRLCKQNSSSIQNTAPKAVAYYISKEYINLVYALVMLIHFDVYVEQKIDATLSDGVENMSVQTSLQTVAADTILHSDVKMMLEAAISTVLMHSFDTKFS